MSEQFIDIIEKEKGKELFPFLKSLDDKQKKQLVPLIKKLVKKYEEYLQGSNGQNRRVGSETQRNMLQHASFVCMNLADYEKSAFSVWWLEKENLESIIYWYCPSWLSEFVNKQSDRENMPYYLNYDWIMELGDKGFIQPGKELVARVLIHFIYEKSDLPKDNKWLFKAEKLLLRNITLEKHIWYLFEVDTSIYLSNRYIYFGEDRDKQLKDTSWIVAFKKLTIDGKIERSRILKESLLASNRNFNKVLSGWFAQLFIELEPTTEEILQLQTDLLSVLNSPQSKPVNTALQYLKKIIDHKDFQVSAFLDQVPALLSTDTKGIIASTIMLLEKIAHKNPSLQLQICSLLAQVFISADDELQTKASNIINTYRDKLDVSFSELLVPYQAGILNSARKILQDIISTPVSKPAVDSTPVPAGDNIEREEISPVNTFDDLVFLASQAFDYNKSWHIDLLPAALIKFQAQLTGKNIARLEPALQRALKLVKNGLQSDRGFLDFMLSIFFIDVCIYLTKKYPEDAGKLHNLFEKFSDKYRWLDIADDYYLKNWDGNYQSPIYVPYKLLLSAALQKIARSDDRMLLSTPTHEPGWIAPEILVQRLAMYQTGLQEPDSMDLQIAMSRCLLENTSHAVALAEKQLTGEYFNLLLFLFGRHEEPREPISNKAAWMTASLARKEKKTYKEFDKFPWNRKSFQTYTGQLEWKIIEEVQTHVTHKFLHIIRPHGLNPASYHSELLYDYTLVVRLLDSENDARRIFLLIPRNPEPFLGEMLERCLKTSKFWQETDRRTCIALMQVLLETWHDGLGNMAHVFVATCMLTSDKTLAGIAGECWLKGVTNKNINNEQLGKAIGRHEEIEFAPLKRFTDLINQQLLRVSDLHNKNLQELLENILPELPDKPITNLKKLLDQYLELLDINHSLIKKPAITAKLNNWKKTSTIQKVAGNLLSKV